MGSYALRSHAEGLGRRRGFALAFAARVGFAAPTPVSAWAAPRPQLTRPLLVSAMATPQALGSINARIRYAALAFGASGGSAGAKPTLLSRPSSFLVQNVATYRDK